MMRLPALMFALLTFSAHADTTVLIETPVKFTVDAKPKSDLPPVTALTLVTNQGSHEFRLTVMQRGIAADAIAAQRARTGWKDGVLFIRDDCLAISERRQSWRCVVDQVFAFVDGREGKRLVHLGDVFAGEDCIEEPKIGCALYQATFTDIYDALENNALTSHAEAPALLLEMRIVSGEFVVDLDETWGRNQERYSAGERCLAATASERATACSEGITPRRAYLFNAALATYTRRDGPLARTKSHARSALCGDEKPSDNKQQNGKPEGDKREDPQDRDCSEALRLSALMLAGIKPGEKARPRGNVRSIPLAR